MGQTKKFSPILSQLRTNHKQSLIVKAETSGKSFYIYFLLVFLFTRKNKGAYLQLDPKDKDGNKGEI
jgi:hypothetical protein